MIPETVVKQTVVTKPKLKNNTPVWYCPGCHYGIMNRLLCEIIEEMGLEDRVIGLVSAGCYVMSPYFIDIDWVQALHGRAPAVATGIKRVHPDAVVFALQGDGDLGAIGAGHFLNIMLRGEKVTTIFLNNACYGQTGGQMAPTTLLNQRTKTTPAGRDPNLAGYPLHAAELAATMRGVAYVARVTLHTPANRNKAKKAIMTAFQKQIDGIGYSLVEILSACPSNWGLDPIQCLKHIDEKMIPEYPLGEFKNVDKII